MTATEVVEDSLTVCDTNQLLVLLEKELDDLPGCANPDYRAIIVEMAKTIIKEIKKRV